MTDHTCPEFDEDCHRCVLAREEAAIFDANHVAPPAWVPEPGQLAWCYEQIVDLMHHEVYLTPNVRRQRLFEIAKTLGAFTPRPTDLSAHTHCDLSVDIVVLQTYRAHASQTDPDELLMPAATTAKDEIVDRIERIWCIDHERVVGEDRLNHLTMEWS